MSNPRPLDKGRLALFAIFSLATTAALSICEPTGMSLVITVGLPAAIFAVSALLDRIGCGWIVRLGQLMIFLGLLFVGNLASLPLNSGIAFWFCVLIAIAIPAMRWPFKSKGMSEAR